MPSSLTSSSSSSLASSTSLACSLASSTSLACSLACSLASSSSTSAFETTSTLCYELMNEDYEIVAFMLYWLNTNEDQNAGFFHMMVKAIIVCELKEEIRSLWFLVLSKS